jgi:hypothetical protein
LRVATTDAEVVLKPLRIVQIGQRPSPFGKLPQHLHRDLFAELRPQLTEPGDLFLQVVRPDGIPPRLHLRQVDAGREWPLRRCAGWFFSPSRRSRSLRLLPGWFFFSPERGCSLLLPFLGLFSPHTPLSLPLPGRRGGEERGERGYSSTNTVFFVRRRLACSRARWGIGPGRRRWLVFSTTRSREWLVFPAIALVGRRKWLVFPATLRNGWLVFPATGEPLWLVFPATLRIRWLVFPATL